MTTPSLRKVGRYALLPFAIICLFIACQTSATAHPRLIESAPLKRSALAEIPDEIVPRFSEPIAPTSLSLALTQQDGTALSLTHLRTDDGCHPAWTLSYPSGP